MIRRPKRTDTIDDILQMQKDFLLEKSKNSSFQPAAKIIKLCKTSAFAQSRRDIGIPQENIPSEFKCESTIESNGYVLGDIVEKNCDICWSMPMDKGIEEQSNNGFPKATRLDDKVKLEQSNSNMSLFALSMKTNESSKCTPMEVGDATTNVLHTMPSINEFGNASNILRNDKNNTIHKQNIEFLNNFDKNEILMERQRLLETIDPTLVKFLQTKRKAKLEKIYEKQSESPVSIDATIKINTEVQQDAATTTFPEVNYFQKEELHDWIHFDVVETKKLEWMRDIPANVPEFKPGETYEARFDWKGVLLPPTLNTGKDEYMGLYLHGDAEARPGYTLQDLFRLVRSTVAQQQIAALNAISGILSIHHQGYYDDIIEIPITKIFFLLRYAMDDNTRSVLDAASRAMSILFYNHIDEALQDLTFDCVNNLVQPTFAISDNSISHNDNDLAAQFIEMNLHKKAFEAKINQEEEDRFASMNDFYLGESDLIKCLLRTDILQRINYVISDRTFTDNTISNCLKILIRIARSSPLSVDKIMEHCSLLKNIFDLLECHPNGDEARIHNAAKELIFKLFRVILGYGTMFTEQLHKLKILKAMKNYIFLQENNVTIQSLKIQTQALRCAKIYIWVTKNDQFYMDIMPALRYTLDWLYQFLNFEQSDQFVVRQCASALVTLINVRTNCDKMFDKLSLCMSKWFSVAARVPVEGLSQVVLLAACMIAAYDCIGIMDEFIEKYLKTFLTSNTYLNLSKSLITTSPLLSKNKRQKNTIEALPDLGAIVLTQENSPVSIISAKYPIYFIQTLARFANCPKVKELQPDFGLLWFNEHLYNYTISLLSEINSDVSTHWFVRCELEFIVDLLKSTTVQKVVGKHNILNLTYKIITSLADHLITDILFLLNNVIFNVDYYLNKIIFRRSDINTWNTIYVKMFSQKFLLRNTFYCHEHIQNYNAPPLLPKNWPCEMLIKMHEAHSRGQDYFLSEYDVIKTTFSYLSLINANNIQIFNETEQFICTLMAFMCKELAYFNEDIGALLSTFVKTTFTNCPPFYFENKFDDKYNFENLYIEALDQFQGVSYGNTTFGALILAPLAQRHDIKWRHMVWSEHIAVLRFIKCNEKQIIGNLEDYLEPVETDRTLLKSYFNALNSNELIPDSLPYRIATHHIEAHKAKIQKNLTPQMEDENTPCT